MLGVIGRTLWCNTLSLHEIRGVFVDPVSGAERGTRPGEGFTTNIEGADPEHPDLKPVSVPRECLEFLARDETDFADDVPLIPYERWLKGIGDRKRSKRMSTISYRCSRCQGPGYYETFTRTNALNHLALSHGIELREPNEAMESRLFAQYFSAREFNSVPDETKGVGH